MVTTPGDRGRSARGTGVRETDHMATPTRDTRRRGPTALTAALVLPLLASCTGDDGPDRADPQATAVALAAALDGGVAEGELDDVAFAGSSPDEVVRDWAETTAGMGDAAPVVEVVGVAEAEDEPTEGVETAAATLSWAWPVAGEAWRYTTTVVLELPAPTDGSEPTGSARWEAQWARTVVEPSLRERTTLDLSTVAARRGEVLGAGGTALVTPRPVVRVGIDRTQVRPGAAAASARALAALADVDPAPYAERVEDAGDEAFVEAVVFRADELPPGLEQAADDVDGALLLPDELPLAPTREFAAPLLGRVGPVTEEMVEDDPDRYRPGDVAGVSGLQARYDEQMRGRDGAVVDAVAASGRQRRLFKVADVDGDPLRTTIDEGLQRAAEGVLAGVGPRSALVALRPSDGAVLALANGPGNEGLDVASTGQYAPGSTFKVVSVLALLRGGLDDSSTVPCTPTVTVDGRDFENYDDYPAGSLGDVPLRTAVAQSCNTALIAERDRAGRDGVADAAAALGLGVDRDLGFPAYLGQVVRPRSETEAAATMIGQGRVLASPLAMAAVVASVQEGRRVTPRLLEDLEPDGSEEGSGDVAPLTGTEAAELRSLLRSVVTDGSGALLADVPGGPVIAKTGTAEFERDGGLLTHAWMVAARDDLAVAVFVEEGSSGSQVAGPLLEDFLRRAG